MPLFGCQVNSISIKLSHSIIWIRVTDRDEWRQFSGCIHDVSWIRMNSGHFLSFSSLSSLTPSFPHLSLPHSTPSPLEELSLIIVWRYYQLYFTQRLFYMFFYLPWGEEKWHPTLKKTILNLSPTQYFDRYLQKSISVEFFRTLEVSSPYTEPVHCSFALPLVSQGHAYLLYRP